jgi:hypothetical protein
MPEIYIPNKYIRFVLNSNGFMDPFMFTLNVKLEINTQESKPCLLRMDDSTSSIIDKIVISCCGKELEVIDNYNIINSILSDENLTKEERCQLRRYGYGCYNSVLNEDYFIVGKDVDNIINRNKVINPESYFRMQKIVNKLLENKEISNIENGEVVYNFQKYRYYSIPILSHIFGPYISEYKYIPLHLFPYLQIEIYLSYDYIYEDEFSSINNLYYTDNNMRIQKWDNLNMFYDYPYNRQYLFNNEMNLLFRENTAFKKIFEDLLIQGDVLFDNVNRLYINQQQLNCAKDLFINLYINYVVKGSKEDKSLIDHFLSISSYLETYNEKFVVGSPENVYLTTISSRITGIMQLFIIPGILWLNLNDNLNVFNDLIEVSGLPDIFVENIPTTKQDYIDRLGRIIKSIFFLNTNNGGFDINTEGTDNQKRAIRLIGRDNIMNWWNNKMKNISNSVFLLFFITPLMLIPRSRTYLNGFNINQCSGEWLATANLAGIDNLMLNLLSEYVNHIFRTFMLMIPYNTNNTMLLYNSYENVSNILVNAFSDLNTNINLFEVKMNKYKLDYLKSLDTNSCIFTTNISNEELFINTEQLFFEPYLHNQIISNIKSLSLMSKGYDTYIKDVNKDTNLPKEELIFNCNKRSITRIVDCFYLSGHKDTTFLKKLSRVNPGVIEYKLRINTDTYPMYNLIGDSRSLNYSKNFFYELIKSVDKNNMALQVGIVNQYNYCIDAIKGLNKRSRANYVDGKVNPIRNFNTLIEEDENQQTTFYISLSTKKLLKTIGLYTGSSNSSGSDIVRYLRVSDKALQYKGLYEFIMFEHDILFTVKDIGIFEIIK